MIRIFLFLVACTCASILLINKAKLHLGGARQTKQKKRKQTCMMKETGYCGQSEAHRLRATWCQPKPAKETNRCRQTADAKDGKKKSPAWKRQVAKFKKENAPKKRKNANKNTSVKKKTNTKTQRKVTPKKTSTKKQRKVTPKKTKKTSTKEQRKVTPKKTTQKETNEDDCPLLTPHLDTDGTCLNEKDFQNKLKKEKSKLKKMINFGFDENELEVIETNIAKKNKGNNKGRLYTYQILIEIIKRLKTKKISNESQIKNHIEELMKMQYSLELASLEKEVEQSTEAIQLDLEQEIQDELNRNSDNKEESRQGKKKKKEKK